MLRGNDESPTQHHAMPKKRRRRERDGKLKKNLFHRTERRTERTETFVKCLESIFRWLLCVARSIYTWRFPRATQSIRIGVDLGQTTHTSIRLFQLFFAFVSDYILFQLELIRASSTARGKSRRICIPIVYEMENLNRLAPRAVGPLSTPLHSYEYIPIYDDVVWF